MLGRAARRISSLTDSTDEFLSDPKVALSSMVINQNRDHHPLLCRSVRKTPAAGKPQALA
jgi:hypothetical protein